MDKKSNVKILWELFFTFFKISPVSFGGGYAMIPLLERAVTEKKQWVEKKDIADVLVLAQTVPGSIAVNTATFIGYRIAGLPGALAGTLGIITPTFFIIVALAALFMNFQHEPLVEAAFMGIRPAIVALIAYAAITIGKSAVSNTMTVVIAVSALVLFLFVPVHPIFILLAGGVLGIMLNLKKIKALKEHRQPGARHADQG
jgi:chromate transporter